MSAEFDELVKEVEATTTVEASAVAAFNGIAARLANNPTPEQVTALAAELKTSADALGAAVVANTTSPAPIA